MRSELFVAVFAFALSGCGYQIAGKANVLPAEVHTIAVKPFANASIQYKLSDYLTEAVTRELITRTRYAIISDPAKADAVLSGTVANVIVGATTSDPIKGATGAQLVVYVQVKLVDKDGKTLFERPNIEYRQQYEISVNPTQYFDESQPAAQRLSRDVAHSIVSAVLEGF